MCVLASGGIRGVDDIKRLNEMGVFAVIFGKAYYEGILNLKDLEQFPYQEGIIDYSPPNVTATGNVSVASVSPAPGQSPVLTPG